MRAHGLGSDAIPTRTRWPHTLTQLSMCGGGEGTAVTCEVMVHPGCDEEDASRAWDDFAAAPDRALELATLCDPTLAASLWTDNFGWRGRGLAAFLAGKFCIVLSQNSRQRIFAESGRAVSHPCRALVPGLGHAHPVAAKTTGQPSSLKAVPVVLAPELLYQPPGHAARRRRAPRVACGAGQHGAGRSCAGVGTIRINRACIRFSDSASWGGCNH